MVGLGCRDREKKKPWTHFCLLETFSPTWENCTSSSFRTKGEETSPTSSSLSSRVQSPFGVIYVSLFSGSICVVVHCRRCLLLFSSSLSLTRHLSTRLLFLPPSGDNRPLPPLLHYNKKHSFFRDGKKSKGRNLFHFRKREGRRGREGILLKEVSPARLVLPRAQ